MGSFGFPSFSLFIMMVRGFYPDGVGFEAFFCLLVVML